MCRVEERVYISGDGSRQTFEDTFPCDKARHGRLCSKVKRKTTEYFPKPPPISRDDASSPASNNPPTPTGTGSYLVEQRRPSGPTRRPSTKGGERAIKPEIIIEFGSRKDKSKKYPLVSVSGKQYKRTELGANSVTSNEVAIESPGSDASYTVRTGFPEAPVPPTDAFGQSQGYTTRTAMPHHRQTSSTSSYTTSSRPPSLYETSGPESPTGRRLPRYPPTIVHNPPPGAAPSSPTVSRAQQAAPSSPYRTTIVSPHDSSRDNLAPDGLSPLDYSDFIDRSASSHASSGAPEITGRGADREHRRKQKSDDRKRQEDADRRFAEELAKEEEVKQVRFELGRAEGRAKERAENSYAEKEKRRAEEREEARRRKKKEDERVEKETRREKTKPPTRDYTKRPGHSRRGSMTQADIEERNRLIASTEAQMALEREATEQREREERAAQLRQQQSTSEYWDPRGGDRFPIPNNGPVRRGSVSGRRGSVSTNAPPTGLGRSNSNRRVSIIQPTPPPMDTQFSSPQQYNRPQSSSRQHAPPPLSFPSSTSQNYSRPPSARRPSYTQENPFAQPPGRISADSQENPFAQPPSARHSPPMASRDPWDKRGVREALPQTRPVADERHSFRRRGEDVINRAANEDRTRGHGRAQQATRNMGKAVGFENDYESSSENEEDKIAGFGARLGMGKGVKRRN